MGKCMFAYPNHADAAAASGSGGSWKATLPLTNLTDRRLHKVARSQDALAASTKFDWDLGAEHYIRAVALPWHNLSTAATIRIRGSNDVTFATSLYDSTALEAYPVIYPAGLPLWIDPGAWDGYLPEDQWTAGERVYWAHVLSTITSARYWRVEIVDTANADGYVDLGRLVIAGGYEPESNFLHGAKFGYEDSSTVTETDGGVRVHRVRAKRRRLDLEFGDTSEDESLVHLLDIQQRYGKTTQIFFFLDIDDTVHLHRRSFLCTLHDLSQGAIRFAGRTRWPFALIEEL